VSIDPLFAALVCPRDRLPLEVGTDELRCPDGHIYPVVQGIPVMLVAEATMTHPYCAGTLDVVQKGWTEADRAGVSGTIDPFVQAEIVKTCGSMYRRVGPLRRYPIPEIQLPPASGASFLEVGSNWGRWSISAAGRGYRAVALDPSLDAALAGTRVADALGTPVRYVVGDARWLPFAEGTFDVCFSYSVLQHFDKSDARTSIDEMARVLTPGGRMLVQLANRYGLKQLVNSVTHLGRRSNPFRVRYWTPREMRRAFGAIGATELFVDGYFSLNVQASDIDLLPRRYRALVKMSEFLKKLSKRIPVLVRVADSLYVQSYTSSPK
jgi:SAM-dependent methyltransferase/uncharacterized protein YbaR (Trm112 family)